ncbi:glycosyltransferase family 39 protein [Halosquirtibacter laminarini]|uniref:Glycosyltransferase family 39 protein n=1 Tax=Halosquirtibacter laminarini TaxID=3374600 RepID=A0AC61NHK8_9BACT|nr:glycosyltransferase family 39 protein [Prolixibacteraceae bacterium]
MNRRTIYLIFFLIITFCSLLQLGQWGLLESSEARYAEIAREMVASGDYLQPQLQGIYHFDKPPVTYWITALGQNLFGSNPFGSRFFLSIAYLLQLILVYTISLKWFQKKRLSEITTLIYASLPVIIMSVRNLTTDAYLNTFSLLAILLYTLSRKSNHPNRYHILWGISLATLFMIKGPVAWLIPLLAIYPTNKICPRQKRLKMVTPWVTALLAIFLGGIWYVQLMKSNPGLWDFFTKEQLVDRFANAKAMKRSEPFYYYLYTFIPSLLPWVFLPFTFKVEYNSDIKKAILFLVAIPLLFFSISSSKLILYPLPTAFGFALWFGYSLHQLEKLKKNSRVFLYISFFLLLPVGMGIYTAQNIPNISIWWYVLLILDFTLIASMACLQEKRINALLVSSLTIPMMLVPYSPTILNSMELEINGTTPVTEFLQQRGLDKTAVIVFDERVASFDFQLQKQTYAIENGSYLLQRNTSFQKNKDWKRYLLHFGTQKSQIIQLVNDPSVLIFKKRVPEEARFLTRAYNKQKQFGKWIIYYHDQDIAPIVER